MAGVGHPETPPDRKAPKKKLILMGGKGRRQRGKLYLQTEVWASNSEQVLFNFTYNEKGKSISVIRILLLNLFYFLNHRSFCFSPFLLSDSEKRWKGWEITETKL